MVRRSQHISKESDTTRGFNDELSQAERCGIFLKRILCCLPQVWYMMITMSVVWLVFTQHRNDQRLQQLDLKVNYIEEYIEQLHSLSNHTIGPTSYEENFDDTAKPSIDHRLNIAIEARQLADEAYKECMEQKRGHRDFAFLRTGGYVIPHLTSSSFQFDNRSTWHRSIDYLRQQKPVLDIRPEMTLQSDGTIGLCWCFQGSTGQLGIGLSHRIEIHSLVIQHIGIDLAGESISSAPRDFELWGIEDYKGDEPHLELLVNDTYHTSYQSIRQAFQIKNVEQFRTYSKIVLKILSNHGNPDFTCLYRVRVHGIELGEHLFKN